jgi:hypothetical protein
VHDCENNANYNGSEDDADHVEGDRMPVAKKAHDDYDSG